MKGRSVNLAWMIYNVSSVIPPIRGNSNHLQSRASRSNRTVILSFTPGKCRDLMWYLNKPCRVEEEKVHCERNTGQELFITAVISGEQEWLDAIKNGWDLHSRNAHMIYGDAWTKAAEDGCAYFEGYHKCSCAKHKVMRTNSKQISFGLIYGISAIGLSRRLKLPKRECQLLVDSFFAKFTKIKLMMQRFANYATKNARIIEPSLGRSRHYDKWKLNIDKERAGVERASMNFPIQSSGSTLLKLSLVLLRRWIRNNGLDDYIRILMPYHDRLLLCINSINCGKLLKFCDTGKDYFISLHKICNDILSNNSQFIRQSAAL